MTPSSTARHGDSPPARDVCPVDLLGSPRFHTDPPAQYREMRREHGSVVPVDLAGFPGWLVIGYRELLQVCGDPELFPRDVGLWNQWDKVPEDWPLRPMVGQRRPSIYFTVGEEHRRHQRMVGAVLEAGDPFELRRHSEVLADRLIDALCGRGNADLITEFAMPLPTLVLAQIIGFPDEDGPAIAGLIAALADAGPDAQEANVRFVTHMHELLAVKREEPGEDVVSRMLAHDSSPDEPFTEDEIIEDLVAITAAGHLNTADWIGSTMQLMLTDDRFMAALGGARHSIPEAMNEVLWEAGPTQILANRFVARDTMLGSHLVRAGDLILLGFGGANTDPHVRQDLPTLGAGDIRSGNGAHLAFSHGEFRCPFPAQEIAEIIARTAVEVLLDRLPDVELSVPAESLVRRPSPFLRGFTALPVSFTPVRPVGDM
jgi:cytochrome P450